MSEQTTARKNRIACILLATGIVLALLMMLLPLYRFTASVFTKKSGNTFVGDEKYLEVKEEVEGAAEEYREKGMDVEVSETVTERTNSKGETTSLVAFSIDQTFSKNIWSFLKSGFPSGTALIVLLILMVLTVVFGLAGCVGSLPVLAKNLPMKAKVLRTLSVLTAVASIVLVPVFVMMNNYTFWRKITLYNDDLLTEGKEDFFARMDSFLFQGKMGEGIESAVKNLNAEHSPLIWILILCLLITLCAAVQIRYGRMKAPLLRILLLVFVIMVCVITLYPYYVMLITAFRSNAETLDMYFLHLLPTKWKWSNLTDIVSRGVPRYLMNSVMIAGGATILAMLCGIPAAFAMSRMNFRGKKFFLGFVIMSQMFSPVVLLIGIAQLMNTLHLNDSILGLVFINAAFNQAFAIWLLRGTFSAISPEMEQAAKIDGCSTIGSLTRILLPMAAPGIVTTLIFVFINAWNEYTISTVLISTSTNRPITVGITQFSSFNMIEWQYLFAASLLATIPVVILFVAIEKHLTSGLTSGGVKG